MKFILLGQHASVLAYYMPVIPTVTLLGAEWSVILSFVE